jgi:(p)ppGpp synthase/HD superfamily hydrolase
VQPGRLMELTQRFCDALTYAFELHRKQIRKGTAIPYLAHLLAVAGIVLEYGGTEDEAISALLHDAVEDQGGHATREEIRRRFGEEVAAIVDACTDTDQTPKPPWKERKEDYIRHIAKVSSSARLVSAADKLHNVHSIIKDYRSLGDPVWQRFNGGKEGALWYHRALVNALRQAGTSDLIESLDRAVSELEKLVDAVMRDVVSE